MNKKVSGYAPSYRCPGCHVELSTGNVALEHMNGCSALRGMIASGRSVVGGIAAGIQKKTSPVGKRQSPTGEKAAARQSHWKVLAPVASVSLHNVPPTKMTPPAQVKGKANIKKPNAKPHRLLDALIEKMHLTSDSALAWLLQVHPKVIYQYRHGKTSITPRFLQSIQEKTSIPSEKLHALIAEMNMTVQARAKTAKPRIQDRCINPHGLLNALRDKMALNSDAALAKALNVTRPAISRTRSGSLQVGPRMLIRMHEVSNIPIQELQALMSSDAKDADRDNARKITKQPRKPREIQPARKPKSVKKAVEPRIRVYKVEPHRLLDTLRAKMSLTSDTALAKALQVKPYAIYTYRSRKKPITLRMLRRMHEASDISLESLHAIMVDMGLTAQSEEKAARPNIVNCDIRPHRLLDTLIERTALKNDAALAKMLGVTPPVVSKHRSGKLAIGANMLIRMHETTNIPIRELRALIPENASGS